jgi:Na+-transporting NADH:ubiquinone oxidoreductase subunit NqrE
MNGASIALLLGKMTIAAAIVVSVSFIAERSKPFIAAMVATLPVSAGPALVFLAIAHGDAFMREALTGSLVTNMALAFFLSGYGWLAHSRSVWIALPGALGLWLLASLSLRQIEWSIPLALLLNVAVYLAAIRLTRRFLGAEAGAIPPRPWFALPLRALGVSALVAAITMLSDVLGPYGSGWLAVFPVVMSSLIVILHPRIGGPATAAMIVSGLPGMVGFAFALATSALLSEPLGRFPALGVGLVMTLTWNGALVLFDWRRV